MKINTIDDKFKKLGFIKTEENKFGARYIRENKKYNYTHCLDILHKASGRHLIQSYEKGINNDKLNNMVGLTYQEMELAMKKYRKLKRKYRWS